MAETNPDDLAKAAEQIKAGQDAALGGAAPSETDLAAGLVAQQSASPGGVTSVDTDQLMQFIKALQDRVDGLEAEKAAGNAVPVRSLTETIRDLLRTHVNHHPAAGGPSDATTAALGLADDAVDAAVNAADSGDGTELGKIGARLARAIRKIHPGPGDHHYINQALGLTEDHLPDAIDGLTPQPKKAAAAVSSDRAPAKVIPGSVTG